MTVLHNVCYSLVPLCINYRTKELQYLNEISQILESDLPTIMPTFDGSRVDPQPHGRYKRFVGTLARILFESECFFKLQKAFSPSKGNETTVNQAKG